MTLTRRVLCMIYDAALSEIRSGMKHKDQTHEEFITACWMQAAIDVCKREGSPLPIALSQIEDVIQEPLDG